MGQPGMCSLFPLQRWVCSPFPPGVGEGKDGGAGKHTGKHKRPPATDRWALDVCFVSPAPVERHARAGGHPVPMAFVPWIPAFAGMTRGHKDWQCIDEMDI